MAVFQSLKIVYVGIHTAKEPTGRLLPTFECHCILVSTFLLPVIEALNLHFLMGEDVDLPFDLENEEGYVQDPKLYV